MPIIAGQEPVKTDSQKRAETLKPPLSLLVKLGSIAVHADEITSPGAHQFDKAALQTLLTDQEVKGWLSQMDQMAFLPKKRKV